MDTPIYDFVRQYALRRGIRAHMPGHKGRGPLGCEGLDITEIAGADSLYEARGIIARSEENASALFGTAATFYSTEGSSQCIRAMVYLALLHAPKTGRRPVIVAQRNAHKAFVMAAALLDLDIVWLWPEEDPFCLCSCPVSAGRLRETLRRLPRRPAAVYVTSPDYLGGMLDIASLAETAHGFGVPLLVDNAHGAYLHFLDPSAHPMDLGADVCCDSAHKTLPVLTGGAYLHIAKSAPADFAPNARRAMALFGSTSPSYLILQSLDLVNGVLSGDFQDRLKQCVKRVDTLKEVLCSRGWKVERSDPLKLTLATAQSGRNGPELADQLRQNGIECEYADPDFLVLMLSPENPQADYSRISRALETGGAASPLPRPALHLTPPEAQRTVREAVLAPWETVPAKTAAGRILAAPTVSCPPAVPVLVSGEVIRDDAVRIFDYYGIRTVDVLCPASPDGTGPSAHKFPVDLSEKE